MDNKELFLEPKTDIFEPEEEKLDSTKDEPTKSGEVEINSEFIKGLPNWDLLPPYETVSRVNRT